ncbi:neopullulanase [Lapidilactobacillus concavus DSM 17758]|uniref:Neopullulanase n=1 Tax=Lapidilactobacillus concavus DSM 17758 TaxID=1423735 RepID=A0A0R1WAR5_9LACO|nr:glycoside hydrolase family 13 protein [Lapidilactobacillus concavus]KRM12932.1 neopullulanase [Lapidilactobacillus concavus DSM 17758]GEL13802.1 alpha-glycosidase [Lapidilactobacillus concavus]
METAAIYHRPESEFAYLYQANDLRLRLRTKRDDVASVNCFFGDPYASTTDDLTNNSGSSHWDYQTTAMHKIASTEDFDYWEAAVQVPYKRAQYDFQIIGVDGQEVLYGDRGVFPFAVDAIGTNGNPFRLPYLHEIDRFKEPDWVRQTVWYQIFPERFANGDPTNDQVGVKPWRSDLSPNRTDYYGGDLQGVLDHLDYLQELGINGIYFCPIFKAYSNHKYDTIDYLEIDPDFGNKELFRQLVEAAHQRGIKVMLDAVFNHIGDRSVQWQDVVANGEQSRFANWFHIKRFPVTYQETDNFESAKALTFDTFAFTPHMPKLNTANPEVKQYLLDVAAYWIKEFDIDAWRLDVANEVDHAFWRSFAETCHQLKSDFYILGEVWHSSQPWLTGDQFSAVMNYAYTETLINGIVNHTLTPTRMVDGLNYQRTLYQRQVNEVMLNTLDSHDTARLLTVCDHDKTLMRQVLAFTFLQEGEPCIYYGDEIGLDGGNDPDCRKPMNWDESTQDHALFKFYQQLIQLRLDHADLLTQGEFTWNLVDDAQQLVIFTRAQGGRQLTATFNLDAQPHSMSVSGRTQLCQNFDKGILGPKGFVITMK